MSLFFIAVYAAFFCEAVETDDNEAFELLDARTMGIREVVRVLSLRECQLRCRRCASLILYPDLTCVIFEHNAPIMMSSFGTICCYPQANDSFECDQCGPHSERTQNGALLGQTNVLGVWTLFELTNHTYKVLPYDCQATPETYERECQKEGAHLASIESAEEDQFVSSLGMASCHCKHIGLHSASSLQQRFQWRDGTKVNYTNWRVGEPFGRGSICAHIWQSRGWASSSCTATGVESVGCCAVCKRQ
uniref:C-type lectin domain-containing protein n=1 Tax=Ascaris lumbricoides TaxID=6252 RepID=A0A0M3I335_ASCLU